MTFLKKLFGFEAIDSVKAHSLEGCPRAQAIVGKYGYTITCPEDRIAEPVQVSPECANAQKVASRYGVTLTCPE